MDKRASDSDRVSPQLQEQIQKSGVPPGRPGLCINSSALFTVAEQGCSQSCLRRDQSALQGLRVRAGIYSTSRNSPSVQMFRSCECASLQSPKLKHRQIGSSFFCFHFHWDEKVRVTTAGKNGGGGKLTQTHKKIKAMVSELYGLGCSNCCAGAAGGF